ncbi:MAG: DUF4982 domain-containing protein [Bacteroidaceae bacterium]|nr:DUF4982 domain-containing protein [Bacteroidaceae bacterium]
MNLRNTIVSFLLPVVFLLLITACSGKGTSSQVRLVENIDQGWLFVLNNDVPSMAEADFDDSNWRSLNLPHDWAIEGSFSKDNPSGTGGGALPGGIGWYRKHFRVSDITENPDVRQKQLLVKFGGVYMNSSVYLNGHLLGTRPYGYISFEYDMTPWIDWEGDNVLAVRVDNSDQPNSRWYSGCGIYRSVYVTVVDPVHIEPWDTRLACRARGEERPFVYGDYDSIVVAVRNNTDAARRLMQVVTVTDAKGAVRFSKAEEIDVAPQALTENGQAFEIQHPVRWSVSNPYLYTMKVELKEGKTLIDDWSFRFGVREFAFNPDEGFSLNAQPMKLNGVCLHHDLGCLGAAVNRRAVQRQLEIMRGCGVNAIRCSHNPPSEELLELCDEMGFLVMDESFDMWRRRKTQRDYARFFDEWHEHDLSDLVRRDRNHPSIVMWSIGNEVLEQWNDASADTLSLEQANMILNAGHDLGNAADSSFNVNQFLTRHLCQIIRSLDTSRPITAGCNAADPRNNLFCEGGVDIIGFNYHEYSFPKVPEWFPNQPFIISESVSSLHTRGYYRMPSDSVFVWPSRWDRPFYDSTYMCSAYDNCHAPWSCTHEQNLHYYDELPYISGQFIWSGFDYIGEPTPYGWPARSSYFGIVDLAGFPKDAYYLYQSVWTDKPMLHVFPHWNWKEGETVDVWAYFNNADEAELFINGKSQGVVEKEGDYHVAWRVKFEPGELRVVTRRAGAEVLSQTIRTAGEPYAVRLTPDRKRLTADGRDLSFVTVEIIDKEGNLCPYADNLVNFSVNGPAFITGVDNGCQTSLESFKEPFRKAFHGKCLVVLQNDGNTGKATLTATSEGLQSAKASLKMAR